VVLAVYSAFSAAVVEGIWHQVTLGKLLLLALVNAILLGAVLFLSRSMARGLGFAKEDEISVVRRTAANGDTPGKTGQMSIGDDALTAAGAKCSSASLN
jgi:predicted Na+-dependent transporter